MTPGHWGARIAPLRPWLTLFFAAVCAWAHDPYEITADAHLKENRVEMIVTMARSTALAVANGVKEAPTFEPADFEKLRPKFMACAPRLFELGAGSEKAKIEEAAVSLTREDDVEFRLSFVVPAGEPLRFTGRLLPGLPYAYGVVLRVDRERKELAVKLLSADDPNLEVEARKSAGASPKA